MEFTRGFTESGKFAVNLSAERKAKAERLLFGTYVQFALRTSEPDLRNLNLWCERLYVTD